MNSTITLLPRSAKPLPTPAIPNSLIGVDIVLLGKLVDSPFETLNAPPYGSLISSPTKYELLSLFINKCKALFKLSNTFSSI